METGWAQTAPSPASLHRSRRKRFAVSPGCKIICFTCQRPGGSLRATLSSFCGSYHPLGKSCPPCSRRGHLLSGGTRLQHNEGVASFLAEGHPGNRYSAYRGRENRNAISGTHRPRVPSTLTDRPPWPALPALRGGQTDGRALWPQTLGHRRGLPSSSENTPSRARPPDLFSRRRS